MRTRHPHIQLDVVSTRRGNNVLKVAAYNSCSRLADGRRRFDFTRKFAEYRGGCVLLPAGADERYRDRQTLWSEAAARETRIDGQPARLIEIEIPREVPADQRLDFARVIVERFVQDECVAAQIDIHCPAASDGGEQPHAHVMLTRRALTQAGWSTEKTANAPWRIQSGFAMKLTICDRANAWLAEQKIHVHLDPRSRAERGDPTPAERNVSRRAVKAWQRDPNSPAAAPFRAVLAQRKARHLLRQTRAAVGAMAYSVKRKPAPLPPKVGGRITAVEQHQHPAALVIRLGPESTIIDRGRWIQIRGEITNAALAELAEHAARRGFVEVELTGPDEYRDRLAAALVARGIDLIGYDGPPPAHLLADARRYLPTAAPQQPAEPAAAVQRPTTRPPPAAANATSAAPASQPARRASDKRLAYQRCRELEQAAATAYAAGGRVSDRELAAARRPRQAVAAGDEATIRALAAKDWAAAQRAAAVWERTQQQAQQQTAPVDDPAPLPAPAPRYAPPWASGARLDKDQKQGKYFSN